MRRRYDTLIVGAGHGGVQVAAELAKGGYAGTVGLLSAEPALPYERPPLSKGYLTGEQAEHDFRLRGPEYWQRSPADLHLSAEVERVGPHGEVLLADGDRVSYGNLVWAAGGRARPLPVPGSGLGGVFTIRNLTDTAQLKAHVRSAAAAVIIGGGYIGLETAAAFRKLGLQVTVLEVQERLLSRVTSPPVSAFYLRAHRDHGVDIRLGARVTELRGSGGALTGVALAGGEVIPAQIAVIGVGMQPNVGPLEQAGAAVSDGVDTDQYCRTTLPDIYAIGDCASQVSHFADGARIRVESVQNAVEQAKTAAGCILGLPRPCHAVPWFWSTQYDIKLKSVGLPGRHDTVVLRGDPATGTFSVGYLRQGRLVAMDCVNAQKDFAHARTLIEGGAAVDPAMIAAPDVPVRDSAVPRQAS